MKVRYDKNGQKRQLATKKAYTRHISESSSSSDNLFSSDDENYSGMFVLMFIVKNLTNQTISLWKKEKYALFLFYHLVYSGLNPVHGSTEVYVRVLANNNDVRK